MTQPVQVYAVLPTLYSRTMKALSKCPYEDVAELIAELRGAPVIDWKPQQQGEPPKLEAVEG